MYSEPDQGSQIEQGVYALQNESWLRLFDPVFCRFRAGTAREYNDAILRSEIMYVFLNAFPHNLNVLQTFANFLYIFQRTIINGSY